jgi:hypothetical protein
MPSLDETDESTAYHRPDALHRNHLRLPEAGGQVRAGIRSPSPRHQDCGERPHGKGEAFVVLKSDAVIYMADMQVLRFKPDFKQHFVKWKQDWDTAYQSQLRDIEALLSKTPLPWATVDS